MEVYMDEIIKTIAWSAPLSAILVTAALWLGRNLLLERLKGSIAFEYNRSLESHKAELKAKFDTDLEILKAKFDTDLEIHKAALKTKADFDLESLKNFMQDRSHLAKAQFDMEFQGYQKLWAALAAVVDANGRLVRLYGRTDSSEDKAGKFSHAEDADRAFFAASTVCRDLRPFIATEVHQASENLTVECKQQIDRKRPELAVLTD
jgi:hypothetical protein